MEQINCHIEWNFRPAECFSLTQTPQKTQNCALADYAKASYSLGSLKGSVVATDANAPRRRACLRDECFISRGLKGLHGFAAS